MKVVTGVQFVTAANGEKKMQLETREFINIDRLIDVGPAEWLDAPTEGPDDEAGAAPVTSP